MTPEGLWPVRSRLVAVPGDRVVLGPRSVTVVHPDGSSETETAPVDEHADEHAEGRVEDAAVALLRELAAVDGVKLTLKVAGAEQAMAFEPVPGDGVLWRLAPHRREFPRSLVERLGRAEWALVHVGGETVGFRKGESVVEFLERAVAEFVPAAGVSPGAVLRDLVDRVEGSSLEWTFEPTDFGRVWLARLADGRPRRVRIEEALERAAAAVEDVAGHLDRIEAALES